MAAPVLTASAVSYLYAGEWAPPPESGSAWTMSAPGGDVDGVAAAANLLNVAIWRLGEQGLVSIRQLRPVTEERVVTLGGKSFARLEATAHGAEPPGLEGRLLAAARDRQRHGLGARIGRIGARLFDRMSEEDEYGVRGLVLALDLNSRHPWSTVAGICRQELCEAGLARMEGGALGRRWILDPAALEANRDHGREIRAAREAYRHRAPDLDDAVAADCAAAIRWAYSTSND